jgi:hypothetical protein
MPAVSQAMERGDEVCAVRPIYSPDGALAIAIGDPSACTIGELKQKIEDSVGMAKELQTLESADNIPLTDSMLVSDVAQPVLLRSNLSGGGSVRCDKVLNFPDVLRVHILCYYCGIENLPDCTKEDWCTSSCCCLHSECGMADWKSCQWLICRFADCSNFSTVRIVHCIATFY